MSDALAVPADTADGVRSHKWGNWLIVAALVFPVIAAFLGKIGAAEAGSSIGQTLGWLLMMALLAWLTTSRRSAITRGNVRLGIGLLLCVMSFMSIVKMMSDDAGTKKYSRELMDYRDQRELRVADLNKRFEQAALEGVLSPENLTTESGQLSARARLSKYRALLAERRKLLADNYTDAEAIINKMPSDASRREGLAGLARGRSSTEAVNLEVDNAATSMADDIEHILDWAKAQGGTLKNVGGNFVFASNAQHDELQAMLAKLEAAEKAAGETEKRVAKADTEIKEREAKQIPEIREHLKQ